jgi:hypothetical protein
MFVSHLHFSVKYLRRTTFIGSRRHGSWTATDTTDSSDEPNITQKLLRPGAFRDKNNLEGATWRVLLVEEVANQFRIEYENDAPLRLFGSSCLVCSH